ncbi:hypothetical protein R7E49_22600 [Vibrio sp. Vb2110]|uniref:hypothetical protein n=1 Tax=Vibrio TaxID=662 RepID=UPI0005421E34|nr:MULTISPECIES: hypothetical protein [Vibrio]ELA9194669.1 hypothetical protein [Vibrio parahaemolyticus]ELU8564430.1 hypothetical protein [Vibrio parahaemolyticus]KHF13175.1 hypothetical protein PO80_19355 [Vibrio parahaemolyticus]MDF4745269.1 hypothetical protein [Vibrio parahaemolyticus]MDG3412905.1 hypothetical protein [Vibrio parahaemolyticus]
MSLFNKVSDKLKAEDIESRLTIAEKIATSSFLKAESKIKFIEKYADIDEAHIDKEKLEKTN